MSKTFKDRLIAKAENDGFLSVEDIEAVFSEVIEPPVAWRYRHKEWGVEYWHYFTNEPRFREVGELWEPLYSAPTAVMSDRERALEPIPVVEAALRDAMNWVDLAESDLGRDGTQAKALINEALCAVVSE